jgi:NAD+ synthase
MDTQQIEAALVLDLVDEAGRIEDFIRQQLEAYQRKGIAIGLSGGLDSAVTAALAVRAVGAEKVTLVNLPERDSSPVHQRHARIFAKHLGAPLEVIPITPTLRAAGTYRLLPLRFVPGRELRGKLVSWAKTRFLRRNEDSLLADRLRPPENEFVARGNAYAIAKHRMRMVRLYQFAETHHLMVAGAANRTEWLTGTFSKWGIDHCADVMPIVHLYRSQVENMGAALALPDYLLNKPADPDVIPGVNDKAALLGDFETVDRILAGLELGLSPQALSTVYPEETVSRLVELLALSRHMRESPYSLL